MQKANQILQAMQKLGTQRTPLTRVYRSLFCEELFLMAYNKIGRNRGSLTPGISDDTADGMSSSRIQTIIEKLRNEQFYFTPVRRIYIEKNNGSLRPLGVPNFSDKLVQEVLRMLLEAYYEPRFSNASHGFRPGKGCHTALQYLKQKFQGATWFIEGDIKGCFDNIDHEKLLTILARDIHDGRLIELIRRALDAGYMDNWTYNKTYSGTPQGSVLSPLLANIYLHDLDTFITTQLIPRNTKGYRRDNNPEYHNISHRIDNARSNGDYETAHKLEVERRLIPSQDVYDPTFRRLQYLRYADDFILGYIGSKAEAEDIKAQIGTFLMDELHLTMSETKTLITHGRTEYAKFLGYSVNTYHVDDKLSLRKGTKTRTRSINGIIRLGIPYGLVDEECKRYLKNGKPTSEPGLLAFSDAHIIDTYQLRFRGLAEYYKFAVDRKQLGKLKYIMECSLVRTLAHKFKTTGAKVYARYRSTVEVKGKRYKVLLTEVPTSKGTRKIYFGGIPLVVVKTGTGYLIDQRYVERYKNVRSDLIQRLQANKCEVCGRNMACQVHHIHSLKDLKAKSGKKEIPEWKRTMIAIQRKTLVVCKDCHCDIHAGRPIPNSRRV